MRKVFLGYTDISKNLHYLKEGMEKLGYDVWLFDYNNSHINSPLNKLFIKFRNKIHSSRSINSLIYKTCYFFIRIFVFANILLFRKTIIISFAGTLFNYKELYWFRLFRKNVIYWFHGSDSRPPYLNKVYKAVSEDNNSYAYMRLKTKQIYSNIKKIEKHVDLIICPISHSQFFEKKIIDPIFIGKPFSLKKNIGCTKSNFPDKTGIKILHAPSKKDIKGSPKIAATIKKLNSIGIEINYLELTGVEHNDVLNAIKESDLIIDQLYSDILIPSITKEAGYLGKPVLLAGYFMDIYKHPVFSNHIPPLYHCEPENIEEKLTSILYNLNDLKKQGLFMQKYFSEHFNALLVAKRLISLTDKGIFESLALCPTDFNYIYGCGYNKREVLHVIKNYIIHNGIDSLYLNHNLTIKDKIVNSVKNA